MHGGLRRYRITDIAAQAGLSRATVDRVLHGRVGVRPETVAQVERAIDELERQQTQIHLSSKVIILDLVMQTPERFAAACRSALEAELHVLRPAVGRARFHIGDHSDPAAAVVILERIAPPWLPRGHPQGAGPPSGHRGGDQAQGRGDPHRHVRDRHPKQRARRVCRSGQSSSRRHGGVPDQELGRLGGCGAGDSKLSHSSFRGEEERERGFLTTFGRLAPDRPVQVVTDTDGLDRTMIAVVRAALRAHPSIDAVYSIGGGNRAILAAFDEVGRRPAVFVAHDLDADNLALLRTHQVTMVLHHDLKADMRRACRLLLQARRVLPGSPSSVPSQVQVVTPFNEPAAMGPSADVLETH